MMQSGIMGVPALSLMLAACAMLPVGAGAAQTLDVLATYYRPDEPFPEFNHIWREREPDEAEAGATSAARQPVLGASVHVLVHNATSDVLAIDDVLLQGISLKRAIAFSDQRKNRKPASIYFAALSAAEKQTLVDAGEPIWWRVDPPSLMPGQTGEATIRLRFAPKPETLRIDLAHAQGRVMATVLRRAAPPRFEGISFSPDRRDVYLYLKNPASPGKGPARILIDARDVTLSARIASDSKTTVTPVVLRLDTPLEGLSFHGWRALWPDGSMAVAGIRVWSDEFAYGMWGGQPGKDSEVEVARTYVRTLRQHSINVQMPQVGSAALSAFWKTEAGKRYCESMGLRFVTGEIGKWGVKDPYAYFLKDEPDAADAKMKGIPSGHAVGSLAQWILDLSREWRAKAPTVPQALNVDLTYKPHNYYVYGQLPDLLLADPYYQPRLRDAYWKQPQRIPVYRKATFVRAISTTVRSAAAPKPSHIILYGNKYIDTKEKREFRYPTPEEKRIEVYYAIGAGAKGISYWWFTPGKPAYGVGGRGPEAERLRREIGLIGAELQTVAPVLLRSCPADIPIKAPVLVVVNEQYVNEDKGTTVTPAADVSVRIGAPSWMVPKHAIEVGPRGLRPMPLRRDGADVVLALGTVNTTRLMVLAGDRGVGDELEARYRQAVAANVASLLGQPAVGLPAGQGR